MIKIENEILMRIYFLTLKESNTVLLCYILSQYFISKDSQPPWLRNQLRNLTFTLICYDFDMQCFKIQIIVCYFYLAFSGMRWLLGFENISLLL